MRDTVLQGMLNDCNYLRNDPLRPFRSCFLKNNLFEILFWFQDLNKSILRINVKFIVIYILYYKKQFDVLERQVYNYIDHLFEKQDKSFIFNIRNILTISTTNGLLHVMKIIFKISK